jgi:hypothetical protein
MVVRNYTLEAKRLYRTTEAVDSPLYNISATGEPPQMT